MSSAGCNYCLDAKSLEKQKSKHLSHRTERGSVFVAIPDEKTTKILLKLQEFLTEYFAIRGIKFCPVLRPHLTLSGHIKELDVATVKSIAEEFVNIITKYSWDFTFNVLFNYIKINLSNANHSPYLCLDLTNIYNASKTYLSISNELHTLLNRRRLLKKSKCSSPAFHLTLGTFPDENAEKVHLMSEHPEHEEECINKQLLMLKVRELLSSDGGPGLYLRLSFEYISVWLVHKVINESGVFTSREDSCRISYNNGEQTTYSGEQTTYRTEIIGEDYFFKPQKTRQHIKTLHDNKKIPEWEGKPVNCHIINYGQKQLLTFTTEESETSFRWRGEIPNEPIFAYPTQHICMRKGSVVVCSKCFCESVINKNGWETQIGSYCAIHTIKTWTINKNKGIDYPR